MVRTSLDGGAESMYINYAHYAMRYALLDSLAFSSIPRTKLFGPTEIAPPSTVQIIEPLPSSIFPPTESASLAQTSFEKLIIEIMRGRLFVSKNPL